MQGGSEREQRRDEYLRKSQFGDDLVKVLLTFTGWPGGGRGSKEAALAGAEVSRSAGEDGNTEADLIFSLAGGRWPRQESRLKGQTDRNWLVKFLQEGLSIGTVVYFCSSGGELSSRSSSAEEDLGPRRNKMPQDWKPTHFYNKKRFTKTSASVFSSGNKWFLSTVTIHITWLKVFQTIFKIKEIQ